VVVDLGQPLLANVMVRARTVPDAACELVRVSMGCSDGIIASCRQAPTNDLGSIKLWLGADPVEDRGEQTIWRERISFVGRTICYAWNIANHCGPAALKSALCALDALISASLS
jgi:hypothetical protein